MLFLLIISMTYEATRKNELCSFFLHALHQQWDKRICIQAIISCACTDSLSELLYSTIAENILFCFRISTLYSDNLAYVFLVKLCYQSAWTYFEFHPKSDLLQLHIFLFHNKYFLCFTILLS